MFELTIEMGNDAMQTAEDVAEQLERTAKKLRAGFETGPVMDTNGNTVGTWSFAQ